MLPLPPEVLEYLLEDDTSLLLPSECNAEHYDGKEEDYDTFGEVDWEKDNAEEESEEKIEQKSFPEFSENVMEMMKTLGGKVFCKLNWSCPR